MVDNVIFSKHVSMDMVLMVLLTMQILPDGLTINVNKVLFPSVKLVCLTVDSSTTSLSMASMITCSSPYPRHFLN